MALYKLGVSRLCRENYAHLGSSRSL